MVWCLFSLVNTKTNSLIKDFFVLYKIKMDIEATDRILLSSKAVCTEIWFAGTKISEEQSFQVRTVRTLPWISSWESDLKLREAIEIFKREEALESEISRILEPGSLAWKRAQTKRKKEHQSAPVQSSVLKKELQIVKLLKQGYSTKEILKETRLSKELVNRTYSCFLNFGEDWMEDKVAIRKAQIDSFTQSQLRDNKTAFLTTRKLRQAYFEEKGIKVSRTAFGKSLRRAGLWFRRTKIGDKHKKYRIYEREVPDIRSTKALCQVAQTLQDPTFELIFVDEVSFNLEQVPTKVWAPVRQKVAVCRENFVVEKFTAVAACGLNSGFLAVQLFVGSLCCSDFFVFIFSVLSKYNEEEQKNLKIFLDRASIHLPSKSSKFVFNSKMMVLNQPAKPMNNFIEALFGKVKYRFKERPISNTRIGEAFQILSCFQSVSELDIQGYRRSYYRTAIKTLLGISARCLE